MTHSIAKRNGLRMEVKGGLSLLASDAFRAATTVGLHVEMGEERQMWLCLAALQEVGAIPPWEFAAHPRVSHTPLPTNWRSDA